MENHSDTNTIPGRGTLLHCCDWVQSTVSPDMECTLGYRVGETVGFPACFSGGVAGDQVAVDVEDQVAVEGKDQVVVDVEDQVVVEVEDRVAVIRQNQVVIERGDQMVVDGEDQVVVVGGDQVVVGVEDQVVVNGGTKRGAHGRWTQEENLLLWECYEESIHNGVEGWKERIFEAWTGRGSRDIKLDTVVGRVRTIQRTGAVGKVEMEGIRRKVADRQKSLLMAQDSARWDVDEVCDDKRDLVDRVRTLGGTEEFIHTDGIGEVFKIYIKDEDEEDETEPSGAVAREASVSGVDSGGDAEISVEEELPSGVDLGDRVLSVTVPRVVDVWVENGVVRPLKDDETSVLKRLREVFAQTNVLHIPSLKAKDRKLVNEEVRLVNGLIQNVKTSNITEVNKLLYAGAFVIAERLGMIKVRKGEKRKAKKEPHWKRRIEGKIKRWRKDLSLVEEVKRGKLKKEKERSMLEKVYGLGEKGTLYVIEFLKGKIHAGSCKVKGYLERELQYHQNNLFKNDQKQLYKELGGSTQIDSLAPDKDEATAFWRGIWSRPGEHKGDAEWIGRVKDEMSQVERQEDIVVGLDDVKGGIRRMTNWKAPGPDGVQGFWFKKFTNVHGRIADQLQDCVVKGDVPVWMTLGRTNLFMKDPAKGPVPENYRPIACLPMMWKLLSGIFAEKMYTHLSSNRLLPDEQKGCRKQSRGTKDQLLIDKMILRDAKRGGKNLAMAWIDYKKAYDMVPHSWLLEVVEMLGVAGNIGVLLRNSMANWKSELMGGGDVLGTVDIKRGIFQGDSLSPLLFVMVMIPLSMLLKAENKGYKLRHSDRRINHLLFMDDLKLYASNDNELESLVNEVKNYSDDIGMEFGLSKCAVLSVAKGKRKEGSGLELPSGEMMRGVEEDGYKYLGVLQKDSFMVREMKNKVKEEYFRRLVCLLKSQLYAGNLIAGINAWAIGVVRYSAGVLDWGKTELKKMDVKTRKVMTTHGAFHRKSNVGRLYQKRKDGGRGLISVEDCVRIEEENLLKYVNGSDEWMLQMVAQEGIIAGSIQSVDYRKRVEEQREAQLIDKPLHGRYFRTTKVDVKGEEIAGPRSWDWVKSGYMTKSTEAYLFAAQEQALRTNSVRANIYREADEDGRVVSGLCRLCKKKNETVAHIIDCCPVLTEGPITVRHDRVGTRIHWELCKKYGVECSSRWYEHQPQSVSRDESGEIIIYWDQHISTATPVTCNNRMW